MTHMYQLAMDPEFEHMLSTQQTHLKVEVVRQPHSDERAVDHARTTGDKMPSNYRNSEVRPCLALPSQKLA